jgi:hypothetical protein
MKWDLRALLKQNPDLKANEEPAEPARKENRVRSGRRADLDNRYFRSSWEANYARYLNWLQANNQIAGWEFEPQTFYFQVKRGPTSYTPDFKILLLGGQTYEWHEIKGHMDPTSVSKLRKFKKFYPAEYAALRLIDGPIYQTIANSVRAFIPTWE